MLAPALLHAYQAAEYHVEEGAAAFTLRIGHPSPALAALLRDQEACGAAFVTACNPHSRPTDPATNRQAQQRMSMRLARHATLLLTGEARDPAGAWPPEPSTLAVGIELPEACAVARHYRQNAIVWAGADGTPRLVLLV